jgi:DHA2 family methylenomycin A resistance protein-like MFS transporter
MTDADLRRATDAHGLAPAAQPSRQARLVLIAAILGFFMISLDATAVNVALSAIGRSLHGSTGGLQWAVDGYTVPFAALLITAGALSDRLGARRVCCWGLTVFTLASAGCGLAPSLWALIAARVVQGSAAAVLLPASLALVRQARHHPAARARAVAVWSSGGATAMAAGPVLGGVLTSAAGWRAIFFVNLPVGVLAVALLGWAPRSQRRSAPLDLAGQATAVLGLAALAYGVIAGGADGFRGVRVIVSLLVAAAATVAFFVTESRVRAPMVPLSLLRSRTVAACLFTGFSINAAFYGIAFLLSLYFQRVLGEPAVTAGLLFLPMTGLLAVANLASARFAARWGHRLAVGLGLSVGTLGMLALSLPDGRIATEVALVPAGAGLGFSLPSLTFLLLDALPAERAGLAGGLFNASRQTGGAIAVAVFGALVSGAFGSFEAGMRVSMLIAAALLAASTAAAFTVLRRPGAREPG